MDDLIYEANHTRDTAVILADAILAILLALIELATHYAKEVILTTELRHELQNVAQFHADYRFLKDNGLHSIADLSKEIQRTESQITALAKQRSKVRNHIRHETDPQVLSENRQDRAEITRQIQPLRQRIKRLRHIQKDTPRLLNLLKTELRAEYALKHPVKEQHNQKDYSYEMSR